MDDVCSRVICEISRINSLCIYFLVYQEGFMLCYVGSKEDGMGVLDVACGTRNHIRAPGPIRWHHLADGNSTTEHHLVTSLATPLILVNQHP